MKLALRPLKLRDANALVAAWHRHHKPARGCVFCLGATASGVIVGVAIVGRPVARMLDDGFTAEVTRVSTNGARNACSFLYGAVARICRTMGFARVITYTLPEEGGASLRAAGWRLTEDKAGGGSWSRDGRERTDRHPTQMKLRWEAA